MHNYGDYELITVVTTRNYGNYGDHGNFLQGSENSCKVTIVMHSYHSY